MRLFYSKGKNQPKKRRFFAVCNCYKSGLQIEIGLVFIYGFMSYFRFYSRI